MRQQMLETLAKYFKDKGTLNRPEYRNSNDVPYTLREVERVFKNYASMLHQVAQVVLPEPAPEPKIEKPKSKVAPKVKRTEVEDSLDE